MLDSISLEISEQLFSALLISFVRGAAHGKFYVLRSPGEAFETQLVLKRARKKYMKMTVLRNKSSTILA